MNTHSYRFLSLMCLAALGAMDLSLVAQQAPQPASSGAAAVSTGSQGIRRVIGFPYSADQVTVTTQTLADGTKITHKRLVRIYRDSEGRERNEFFKPGVDAVGQEDSPQSVNIYDPVAGVSYYLNPRERTAQKREIRRPTSSRANHMPATSTSPTPAQPVPPRPTVEDLGTQVIEGLEAKGQRITRIIPAGAEGNDQPIQITSESWYSSEPRIPLIYITNDPRHGETVMHLTNLALEEPPAELFQVPPGYTVEELQPVAKPTSPSD